jgi:hypothetical protein
MKRFFLAIAAATLLMLPLTRALDAQQTRGEIALRRAMETQTVKGDLLAAIQQYRKIVDEHKTERSVVARALLQMAECYETMGEAKAYKHYTRIIEQYSDQADVVGTAKARLARAKSAKNPGPFLHRPVWSVSDGGDVYGRVSHDGRYLAYTNWNERGDLFLHDFVNDSNRRLTTQASKATPAGDEWGEETAFSRDSRQLAFSWGKGERYQLRVVAVDAPGMPAHRVLIDNPEIKWLWPEDWTPDGQKIAVGFQRSDGTAQIGLVSATDGAVEILKAFEWRGDMKMVLSPDGRYLAYDIREEQSHGRDVFVLKVDGTVELPAAVHPGNDAVIGWSPDGTRLLVSSERAGAPGIWSIAFANGRIDGPPQLLRPDIGRARPAGLTASGALFMTTPAVSIGSDIKLASFDFRRGALHFDSTGS